MQGDGPAKVRLGTTGKESLKDFSLDLSFTLDGGHKRFINNCYMTEDAKTGLAAAEARAGITWQAREYLSFNLFVAYTGLLNSRILDDHREQLHHDPDSVHAIALKKALVLVLDLLLALRVDDRLRDERELHGPHDVREDVHQHLVVRDSLQHLDELFVHPFLLLTR